MVNFVNFYPWYCTRRFQSCFYLVNLEFLPFSEGIEGLSLSSSVLEPSDLVQIFLITGRLISLGRTRSGVQVSLGKYWHSECIFNLGYCFSMSKQTSRGWISQVSFGTFLTNWKDLYRNHATFLLVTFLTVFSMSEQTSFSTISGQTGSVQTGFLTCLHPVLGITFRTWISSVEHFCKNK